MRCVVSFIMIYFFYKINAPLTTSSVQVESSPGTTVEILGILRQLGQKEPKKEEEWQNLKKILRNCAVLRSVSPSEQDLFENYVTTGMALNLKHQQQMQINAPTSAIPADSPSETNQEIMKILLELGLKEPETFDEWTNVNNAFQSQNIHDKFTPEKVDLFQKWQHEGQTAAEERQLKEIHALIHPQAKRMMDLGSWQAKRVIKILSQLGKKVPGKIQAFNATPNMSQTLTKPDILPILSKMGISRKPSALEDWQRAVDNTYWAVYYKFISQIQADAVRDDADAFVLDLQKHASGGACGDTQYNVKEPVTQFSDFRISQIFQTLKQNKPTARKDWLAFWYLTCTPESFGVLRPSDKIYLSDYAIKKLGESKKQEPTQKLPQNP